MARQSREGWCGGARSVQAGPPGSCRDYHHDDRTADRPGHHPPGLVRPGAGAVMAPADAGDTESLVPQPDREANADRARGPVPPDLHGAAAEEQGHGAPGCGEVSNEVRTRRRRGILQPLRRGRPSSSDVARGRSQYSSTAPAWRKLSHSSSMRRRRCRGSAHLC